MSTRRDLQGASIRHVQRQALRHAWWPTARSIAWPTPLAAAALAVALVIEHRLVQPSADAGSFTVRAQRVAARAAAAAATVFHDPAERSRGALIEANEDVAFIPGTDALIIVNDLDDAVAVNTTQ